MVMFDCHAQGVEKYQDDDKPIKPLLLDGASDEEAAKKPMLVKVRMM